MSISYAGQAKEHLIYLNGVFGGHKLEDVPAIVVFDVEPAEPDVGVQDEIVFLYLESTTGNALTTLSNSLSEENIDKILDQIDLEC